MEWAALRSLRTSDFAKADADSGAERVGDVGDGHSEHAMSEVTGTASTASVAASAPAVIDPSAWGAVFSDGPGEATAKGAALDIGSEVARLVALVVGLGVESALLGVRKSRPTVMRLVDDQLSTLEA